MTPEPPERPDLRAWARGLPFVGGVLDHEASRLLAAGVIAGVLGGGAAGAFDRASILVGDLALGTGEPASSPVPWWRLLVAPALAGVLGGALIGWGTERKRPQSVPDVLVRAQVDGPALSLRDGLASAFAAALVVGGGQSGGREGPIVQIASTLANTACGWFGVPPRHFRALVASGAAAGIAASFNTPVGGAFFALEIILGDFGVESFAPVVAATVTGTVVGQALLGDRIALHLPPFRLQSPVELGLYLVLGVLSGVIAVLFKRALLTGVDQMERLALPAPLRTGLAGLAVGALAAIGLNAIMGNGYVWMERAISDPSTVGSAFLAALLIAKIGATAITTGGRGGAGLFAPSLHVGAILGLLVGKCGVALAPSAVHSPGAFGMVGMAAVASGVMHAPITMTLMLFEMTGNYEVILPLLVAVAAAGLVSRALGAEPLYHAELRHRGVTLQRRPTQLLNEDLRVRDLMRSDPVLVEPSDALPVVAKRMLAARVEEAFVVERDPVDGDRLIGTVQLAAVTEHLFRAAAATARDLGASDLPTIGPDQPVGAAVPLFFHRRTNALPVVDGGRLVGVLLERDVIAAYHQAVEQHETLLARFVHAEAGHRSDVIELPEGHVVEVVEIDEALAGRSLWELELPVKRRCMVVACSAWEARTGTWVRGPIEPRRKLVKGDRLVVVGPADEVARLRIG